MSRQEKGPLQLIYERLYVVAIATLAALAVAWLVADRLTPTYRSQARCFMPTKSDVISLSTEEGNLPEGPKLPLGVEEIQDSLLGVLRGADLRQQVAAAVPGRSSVELEKNVDFEVDKYNLITISAYDTEPEMAQRIAQEYLKGFRARLDETTKVGIRQNAEVLSTAIEATLASVKRVETERQEFLRGQGTVDYGTQFELVADKVKKYTQKLDELDASLASLTTGLAEMQRQRDARPPAGDQSAFVARGTTTVANPALDGLKEKQRAARAEYEHLLTLFKEGPNEVAELKDKREEIRLLGDQIAAEEERIAGSEEYGPDPLREQLESKVVDQETRISATQAERAQYVQLLAAAQAEFQKLPEYALKLDDFNSELSILKMTLSNQRNRLAELDLYLKRTASFLSTAEDPALPVEPWFPNMPLILLAAGVLGLVLSITAVVTMSQVAQFREESLW